MLHSCIPHMSEKADDNESIKQPESLTQESNVLLVEWSPENEKIVVEWCDIAQCYKWLHTRAHQSFSSMHAWFTIPAIILSTISGTASFAQGSLPVSMQTMAPMVIGSVNIFIGILTTIQQYLKISEYNESHRVSAIAWDKFARNIRIELAKHPDERSTDAGHFLKTNRDEFDRLMETSPSIPIRIVDEFLETFSGQPVRTLLDCCSKKKKTEHKLKKEEEMKKKALMFEKLKKPDVCNIIVSADDNRHPWYKEASKPPSVKSDEVIYSVVSQKINKIQQDYEKRILQEKDRSRLELEMREHDEIEKKRKQDLQLKFLNNTMATANKVKEQHKIIDNYVKLFSDNHGRSPLTDEIRIALVGAVDEDILQKFLDNYKPTDEEEEMNFDIQFEGDDRV
jgi:hypothetical protein